MRDHMEKGAEKRRANYLSDVEVWVVFVHLILHHELFLECLSSMIIKLAFSTKWNPNGR